MPDIFWVPIEHQRLVGGGLSIGHVFDWAQKIWVPFTSLFPEDSSARRHLKFIGLGNTEWSGKWRPDQFWYQVAANTAKLLADMGARDKHLLAAIAPIPNWPSKVVMLYNSKAEMAACLVGYPPQVSDPPSWWIQDIPTRFERDEVI
jgi:hypothetical protein